MHPVVIGDTNNGGKRKQAITGLLFYYIFVVAAFPVTKIPTLAHNLKL
jgi:hypothetical protein